MGDMVSGANMDFKQFNFFFRLQLEVLITFDSISFVICYLQKVEHISLTNVSTLRTE